METRGDCGVVFTETRSLIPPNPAAAPETDRELAATCPNGRSETLVSAHRHRGCWQNATVVPVEALFEGDTSTGRSSSPASAGTQVSN
jgi:hypothetical protein